MTESPQLYLWLDREPGVFEPDLQIEDIPGTADIDLLTEAILGGQLGTTLPARIYMSPNRNPDSQRAVRTIDIGRLLRDLGIQHRRCYQIDLPR